MSGVAAGSLAAYLTPTAESEVQESVGAVVDALLAIRHQKFPKRELAQLVETFTLRGGQIELQQEETPVEVALLGQVVVGCNSGVNRSQALAAYLTKEGVKVSLIIAGLGSRFNPHMGQNDFPLFGSLYSKEGEENGMKSVFGEVKRPRLGEVGDGSKGSMDTRTSEWYENQVKNLSRAHFISFAACGPNALARLVKTHEDLTGFRLTIVDWEDTIAHPTNGSEPFSEEAYKAMKMRFQSAFVVKS